MGMMKRLFLPMIVCALALAVIAGAQDSGAGCYASCKQNCISQQRPAEECAKMCSSQCPSQGSAAILTATALPVEAVKAAQLTAVQIFPCEDECKREATMPADSAVAGFNKAAFEQCIMQRCRKPMLPVEVPPGIPAQCACPACPVKCVCPVMADCDMKCVDGYRQCVMKAMQLNDKDEQNHQVLICRENVGQCLDSCPMTVRAVQPSLSVVSAGPAQPVVGPVQLVRTVQPQPVIGPILPVEGVPPIEPGPSPVQPGEPPAREPSCDERCGGIKKDCEAVGIGEEACANKIAGCVRACKFQQPSRDCAGECRKAGEECVASGYDAESCRVKADNCVNACPPRIGKIAPDGAPGGEAKPVKAEAKTGFFARLLRVIGIG